MSYWHVFPALHEEAKEGWVWTSRLDGPTTLHVLLKKPNGGPRVVCEQRLIDRNFHNFYNQRTRTSLPDEGDVLVISAYYRERLGLSLSAGDSANIEVLPLRGPIAGLRAGVAHPSSAIRTATWLGILSALLGALSLALAVAVFFR